VEPSEPVTVMFREMVRSFRRHMRAPGRDCLIGIFVQLTTVKHHSCERRTEIVCEEDGNCTRGVERDFRMLMKWAENTMKRWTLVFNSAPSIPELLPRKLK
jgi:hypothetical protein